MSTRAAPRPVFRALFLLGLVLALPDFTALAMDSTQILPKGINSPAFRYGVVSGVDSKYSSDGSVRTLNDINTIEFNEGQLVKLDADVSKFTEILNQYSQQRLGSQVNLGTLRVETEPNVTYIAPIFARGVSDRLTLAVALPVVFYKNNLQMTQSSSNVDAICSQFTGIMNDIPDLKEACDKLNLKVTDAVRGELAKEGYKEIKNRDETVVGDVQLVGLWKTHEAERHSSLLKTTLTLPTGQKDDPDDLADLGIFGMTAIEPVYIFNYLLGPKVTLAAKAGYKLVVPDSQEARVPGSEGDILPGPETKEKVSRDIGDSITLGGALNWDIWQSFSVAGGYEYIRKGSDRYSGRRDGRYDLLGKDTESRAHRLRTGLSYNTIGLYQRTKSFPPLKVDFEVTNTVAGKNTDRELVNEFSLTMFF
jgi:hypothetical protein